MEPDRLFVLLAIFVWFRVTHATRTDGKRHEYTEPTTFRAGELNEPCRINDDCGTFGYFCAPNKTCQCAGRYVPNHRMKACLGGIDQRCQYDEHCIDGAFCMSQSSCQCKERRPYRSADGLQCTNATSKCMPSVLFITVLMSILLYT